METKLCSQCEIDLPLDEFFGAGSKKKYVRQPCKSCRRTNRFKIDPNGKKKCSRCKEIKTNECFGYADSQSDGLKSYCKECAGNYRKDNIKQTLLYSAKHRAKEKGLEFDLSEKDITIPKICPVLGIKIIVPKYEAGGPRTGHDNSPSLDRIDSTVGYIKKNIRVVSWRANRLKGDGTFADFQKINAFLFSHDSFLDLSGDDKQHLESVMAHINNVKENCQKLANRILSLEEHENKEKLALELIRRGHIHDNSKFVGVEWMYLRDGVKEQHPELFNAALFNHVTTSDHHPEFWGNIYNMPEVALCEMVCDWKARSEEMGTDFIQYIKDVATKRFEFKKNDKTYRKIMFFVNLLLEKPFS